MLETRDTFLVTAIEPTVYILVALLSVALFFIKFEFVLFLFTLLVVVVLLLVEGLEAFWHLAKWLF